jgi:hypothetical protein
LEDRNQYNSDQYLALLDSLMDAMQQENLWGSMLSDITLPFCYYLPLSLYQISAS